MADPKTTVIIDLDNKEFIKKLKESLGLLGEIGKTESVKELANSFIQIGKVAGIAAAAAYAVKAAVDWTEEAEKIKQIQNSFLALADAAGVAGERLKEDLVGATKGLADSTEVMAASNKAIVALGENADKLPQIMDVARKATALFGGNLVSNFESMSNAIAAGNTRMLRQYGIIIDNDKALKDYAATLGIHEKYLSEAGRKQAILNAALTEAKKKFKDVDETVTVTKDSFTKMHVALGDIKEAAVLAWDKIAGPTVRAAVSGIADGLTTLALKAKAAFGSGAEATEAQNELLEKSRASLQNQLEMYKKMSDGADLVRQTEKALDAIDKKLEAINEENQKSYQLEAHKQAAIIETGKVAEETANKGKSKEDTAELLKAREKFEKDLFALRKARLEDESKLAMTEVDALNIQNEQKKMLIEESERRIKEIKKEYNEAGMSHDVELQRQFAQAREEIETQTTAKIIELNNQTMDIRIKAYENAAEHAKTAGAGIGNTFEAEALKSQKNLQNFGKFGQVVFGSLKKNASNAFAAIGDGSKTAGEAMRGFMFGAIADIATAQGEEMLAFGIGSMNPLAIAEGGVLIALGSLLRSQAKGSTFGGAGGGGGGGGGGGATAQTQTAAPATQEAVHKKSVQVNIAGSFYETEQTRTRLMDMIREAGDFTDFQIRPIGVK